MSQTKALKRFTDTLMDVRGGDLVSELTGQMRELVAAVKANGGSGELTLRLKVKRAAKGTGSTLVIVDEVKVKPPKFEENETILFANEEGDLQRSDPRQPRLTGMEGKGATVTPITGVQEATNV